MTKCKGMDDDKEEEIITKNENLSIGNFVGF